MLCLYDKPTTTPKHSMWLQYSTKQHWIPITHDKPTLTTKVFNAGFNASMYQEKRKKRSTDINFQVFNVEFITVIRKKSVHCWVCIDKPTLTPKVFNAGFNALCGKEKKSANISSRTQKHWHFKSSMLSSIPHHYTFMVVKKSVEFASTNQHWHQ